MSRIDRGPVEYQEYESDGHVFNYADIISGNASAQ